MIDGRPRRPPVPAVRAARRLRAHGLGADASLAPRLERRRGDREVLDREAGRVEQRHRLGAGPSGHLAGQHRAELADAIAVNQPGVDRPGQLAAVRGLRPLVAEQRARRDRADGGLGLAGAVGSEHVEVQARPADPRLRPRPHGPGVTQHTTSQPSACSREPGPAELGGEGGRGVGVGIGAHARAVPGGGHAPCGPDTVQPAADDPHSPRVLGRASACVATAATAPVRSAVTERASSSISGCPVVASERQMTPVTVGSPRSGLPGNDVIHFSSASPSPRTGIARKSPNGGHSRYTLGGITQSPA